jgi:hypothetical protein
MPSVTLQMSGYLAQDDLVAGVIENVVTVNRMFDMLPFDGIDGNALAYNRELVLGGVGVAGVGTAITDALDVAAGKTAKNAATFTPVTSMLTTIIGDANVNGMIQATRSSDGNDQRAVQVASKAKSLGRQFQTMLITGTGANFQFSGLDKLMPAGQKVTPAVGGQVLAFVDLDTLIDTISDKDGAVDYILMHARTLRSFNALLRALGGASINDTVELPSGNKVPAYRGIPIFRNDYILTNVVQGGTPNTASVYAGTFDDGSRTHGIAGLTASKAAGINVVQVGEAEDADESITRVKWYCGFAVFSELGIGQLTGVTN